MQRVDIFPSQDGAMAYPNLDSVQITEQIMRYGVDNFHLRIVNEGEPNEYPEYTWYAKTLHVDEAGQLCLGPEVEVYLED